MPEAALATGADSSAQSTVQQSGTQTQQAAPWHGQTEPDAVAYVQNKGWQSAADVVKSYQGAEKLIGRDPNTLLVMPRADDPEGFRAVMTKLGLPESPDKYEFAKAEGLPVDAGYEKWSRDTFHKLGLPASVVKALTAEHNAYVKGVLEQQTKDYEQRVAADKSALVAEWRDGHERMMNAAQSAAKNLGFTGEMIDALEKSIGYAATMKFFANMGQKMGEDGFVTSGEGKPGKFGQGLTPAEAKAEWDAMKADPVMSKALFDPTHPAHAQAKARQERLFKTMYPD